MTSKLIDIEVVFALPERQSLVALRVPANTTVERAIHLSQLQREFPTYDFEQCDTGIFGGACGRQQVLKPGDRVELYRPLIADPKDVRRKRARLAREAS